MRYYRQLSLTEVPTYLLAKIIRQIKCPNNVLLLLLLTLPAQCADTRALEEQPVSYPRLMTPNEVDYYVDRDGLLDDTALQNKFCFSDHRYGLTKCHWGRAIGTTITGAISATCLYMHLRGRSDLLLTSPRTTGIASLLLPAYYYVAPGFFAYLMRFHMRQRLIRILEERHKQYAGSESRNLLTPVEKHSVIEHGTLTWRNCCYHYPNGIAPIFAIGIAALHTYTPHWKIVTGIAIPALMIGTRIGACLHTVKRTPKELRDLITTLEERHEAQDTSAGSQIPRATTPNFPSNFSPDDFETVQVHTPEDNENTGRCWSRCWRWLM